MEQEEQTKRRRLLLAEKGGHERTYKFRHTLEWHSRIVLCIIIDSRRSIFCTGSADWTIRVWDLKSNRGLHVLDGHTSAVWCLSIVPGTDLLASGGADGSIIIFDLSTLKLSYFLPDGHSRCVNSLLTVPGTTLLVSCSNDKMIKVWDVVTRKFLRILEGHESHANALANVPGNLVASGSDDGSIKLWNPATGACERTIADDRTGRSGVLSIAYLPGLDMLASGGYCSISLWDFATGLIKASFSDAHSSWVLYFATVPGTTLLASSSADMHVKVWDAATGKCVQTLSGHGGRVYGIAVDSSRESLLSVSGDRTVKVWTDLKAARASIRYCVLACLSSLATKLNAGEHHAVMVEVEDEEDDEDEDDGDEDEDEDEDEEDDEEEVGGGNERRLQGVSAFDSITSADVWRYILEFV